jgi:hypothetical protein
MKTRAQLKALEETNRKRKLSGLWSSLLRQDRSRWVITFNCTGSWNPETGNYTRYVWPILFRSREAADAAVKILPVFANAAAIPGRGRIKSVCVEPRKIAPRFGRIDHEPRAPQ